MSKPPDTHANDQPANQAKYRAARYLLAVIFCLLATAYTIGVVFGMIPKEQRIDAVNLIIIGIAAAGCVLLVHPDIIERLRRLKVAGFEFEIDRLKEVQKQQEGQLHAINLLLPLVLKDAETKHLKNLAANTTHYVGDHDVRSELRKLRAMGLIRSLSGQPISAIKDGISADISRLVGLTDFGHRIVRQVGEIEEAKARAETDE